MTTGPADIHVPWLAVTAELPPMPCRYGVPLLNSYNSTVGLHLGHIFHPLGQVQDCLHYCSPGIPEVRAAGDD
jgi:hypothetical protein